MATYTKETALYDTAAISTDIADAGTKATNYLSADSSGIMIYDGSNGAQTPSNPASTTRNVFIDEDSVDVRLGSTTLATFGEITTVGDTTGAHAEIMSNRFSIYNGTPTECFLIESTDEEVTYGVTYPYNDTSAIVLLPSKTSESGVYTDIPSGIIRINISVTYGGSPATSNISYSIASGSNNYTMNFEDGSRLRFYFNWTSSTNTLRAYANDSSGLTTRTKPVRFKVVGYTISKSAYAPTFLYGSLSNSGKIGAFSSAMGLNVNASGNYSQAVGIGTEASGADSYAQNCGTIANGICQTVIGRYNIASTDSATVFNKNNTAFIIGNGNNSSNRSNALTVDFNGNIDIASGAKYKIGGTNLSASDVGAVPTSRKVNNKALSADITLSASDVGALATSKIQGGHETFSSIATNSYADKTITFNPAFAVAPNMVATLSTSGTAGNIGNVTVSVFDISKTGATIRVFNNRGSALSPAVEWIAIDI